MTDATSDSVIWTASEVTTTIVCLTLPALRPLYNKVRGQESSSAGYQQHDDSTYKPGGSYALSSFPAERGGGDTGFNKNGNFANVEAGRSTVKNASDETILLQGDDKRNIRRVQEVSISYENTNMETKVTSREAV